MKIAISATAGEPEALVDPRFGRSTYFLILDDVTNEWEAHHNSGAAARGGAGIRAAEDIARLGAEAVISGEFGPNAYEALSAVGVRMYRAPSGEPLSARDLVVRYAAGDLEQVQAPTGGEPSPLPRRGRRPGTGRGGA